MQINKFELLKEKYRSLYSRISNFQSNCSNLKTRDVIEHLAIEGTNGEYVNPNEFLNDRNMAKGLLINDKSGIALYTLAYYLANQWADNKLFQKYDAVLLVPIEQVHKKLFEVPNHVNELFKVWDTVLDATFSGRILVIFSGCTDRIYSISKNNEAIQENILKKRCIELGQTVEYMIIANKPALSDFKASDAINITLKPIYLGITYLKDDMSRRKNYYISSKVILDEAQSAVEQTFFHQKESKSIRTTKEYHKQVIDLLNGGQYNRSTIAVNHVYKAFSSHALIRSIIGATEVQSQNFEILLKAPAEWFCAAITGYTTDKDVYTSYNIGGHLIARNLKNHYLVNLGLVNTLSKKIVTTFFQNSEQHLDNLKSILSDLLIIKDFDSLDQKRMLYEINQIKRRQEQEKKISKLEDKKSYRSFLKLVELLTGPNEEFLGESFGSIKNVSYLKIQFAANEEFNTYEDKFIVQHVREILKGGEAHTNLANFVLGLSATLIGETGRYPINFLAVFCLFDLIEYGRSTIKRNLFSHAGLEQLNPSHFEDAIQIDVLQSLGGILPLTHANSFNMVSQMDEETTGLNWVQFKAARIIIDWLSIMLEIEKSINPYLSCTIVSTIEKDSIVIDDLLHGLRRKKVSEANPYIFDRLTRRLDSFDFLLIESKPLLEILPTNIGAFDDYASKTICKPIKFGLPCDGIREYPENLDKVIIYKAPLFRLQTALYFKTTKKSQESINEFTKLLDVDPYFYHAYYFIAVINLYDLKDYISALHYINLFIENAGEKMGEFYTSGLYVRIRTQLNLCAKWSDKDFELFKRDVRFYLCNFVDETNNDYWRVFAARGIANHMRYIETADNIRDFKLYLNNGVDNEEEKQTCEYQHIMTNFPELKHLQAETNSKSSDNEFPGLKKGFLR